MTDNQSGAPSGIAAPHLDAEASTLGRSISFPTTYDPGLLYPILRQTKRSELGCIKGVPLPFFGVDFWNAYEMSWLNLRGKPQVAILRLDVPADSPALIESKSLKLYLNGFSQTRLGSEADLLERIQADLSQAAGAPVRATLRLAADFSDEQLVQPTGLLLDRLDIEVDRYAPDPALLRASDAEAPVDETLLSHLLKSNCLITGQPDWATIQIRYVGAPISQEGLLRYLIGFRTHDAFHEQCVERIFIDILRECRPTKLSVYARYTRRGGIDINPWRSNFTPQPGPRNLRWARQ